MAATDAREVWREGRRGCQRPDGAAILGALAAAHQELARGEVDVLDAERQRLEQPEPAAVDAS
jgi:hypothetical protein